MTVSTATTEAMLCQIIAEVIGLDLVRPQDGFFEVGGDSVLALQVVARAREAGLTLTVRDLFDNQTPEALAAVTGGPVAATSIAGASAEPGPAGPPLLTFAADELDEFEDIETGEQGEQAEAGWE